MKRTGDWTGPGGALSFLRPTRSRPMGFSLLDDYLPWEGWPVGALTLLEGQQSARFARELMERAPFGTRSIVMHTLNRRPYFRESEGRFRLQTPTEADLLASLPELLKSGQFDVVYLHLHLPVTRARAQELADQARLAGIVIVVVSSHLRFVPWECAELVIEAQDDWVAIRKAAGRPVPLWLSPEMLGELAPATHDEVSMNSLSG